MPGLPTILDPAEVYELAATTAGAAVSLKTAVNAAINAAGKPDPTKLRPVAYEVQCKGSGPVYLRTAVIGLAAANTGKGLVINPGESRLLPGAGQPGAADWAYESATAIYVAVYYDRSA